MQMPNAASDKGDNAKPIMGITKVQKNTQAVTLAIERVLFQRDFAKHCYLCRVIFANTGETEVAENVHVRINGEVIPNVYREGYSPFNEPDLPPLSGSRLINPNSMSDWNFPESFGSLVEHYAHSINVLKSNYGITTKDRPQTFTIEASAKNSSPVMVAFEILKDSKTGKPVIRK